MSHLNTLDALDKAREFLLDYPEVPTPCVYIDATGATIRWHLDRQTPEVALEVLRLWSGWTCMELPTCNVYTTRTADRSIQLDVYATAVPSPVERVNLLDALTEASA